MRVHHVDGDTVTVVGPDDDVRPRVVDRVRRRPTPRASTIGDTGWAEVPLISD